MTSTDHGLTDRQRLVLATIGDYWDAYGYAPTIRDISCLVDRVPSSVGHTLKVLEGAGLITRTPRIPRSMKVVTS